MIEIEIAEVQNRLMELLSRVEQGEFVSIMKDGYAVAFLTPTINKARQDASRAASERIRVIAQSLLKSPFDWEEMKLT